MEYLTAFILYLTFFRLAIIAAGIISIILGYRLFVRGVFSQANLNTSPSDEEVKAEFAGAKFTLKNTAPGTGFALFGVMIIVSMFIQGNPEFTLELLERGRMKGSPEPALELQEKEGMKEMKLSLRGDEVNKAHSHSKRALNYLNSGEKDKALKTAHEGLKVLAEHMNDLAWVLYKTESKPTLAGLLAEAAVTITPDNPDFIDTLAKIQFMQGKKTPSDKTPGKNSSN